MRILLVEDSVRLSKVVSDALCSRGFTIDPVASATDALASMSCGEYDLMVLDLGLPDMDGMELLKKLRNEKNSIPILVLTAREGTSALISGLNGGADDFLRKPFEIEELIARIHAILRRPGGARSGVLSEGNVQFDTVERNVSVNARTIDFSRLESCALEVLMRRAGRVVSRTALEDSLYGFSKEIESNAIEVVLHRLRKKLQKAEANLNIHTLRGVGYILSPAQ